MSKKFYVFIDCGSCDPALIKVCENEADIAAFLLENREWVDDQEEDTWIIYGERFGFKSKRQSVHFTITGPDDEAPLGREEDRAEYDRLRKKFEGK